MKRTQTSERNATVSERSTERSRRSTVELKVAGVLDMLEQEFHVLTAIEQGKIIGGGSGSGGDMSSSDPIFLQHTSATNAVYGEFANGDQSTDPGSYLYEGDVNTYYDPTTQRYSLNVGATILSKGSDSQKFNGTVILMHNGVEVGEATLAPPGDNTISPTGEVGTADFVIGSDSSNYSVEFDVQSYRYNYDGTWQADNTGSTLLNPTTETVNANF